MKKLLVAVAGLALTAGISPVAVAPAQAQTADEQRYAAASARAGKTVCHPRSGSSSGRCWTYLRSVVRVTVIEAIPLENRTARKRTNMHCSFSRTVSRSVETGGEVSSQVSASLFKVVDASVAVTVHRNVTQTSEQASTAGGDVTLRPGERVVCQRTYGHVIARVRDYRYYPGGESSRIIRVRVPANLGVRIVD